MEFHIDISRDINKSDLLFHVVKYVKAWQNGEVNKQMYLFLWELPQSSYSR